MGQPLRLASEPLPLYRYWHGDTGEDIAVFQLFIYGVQLYSHSATCLYRWRRGDIAEDIGSSGLWLKVSSFYIK